MKLMSELNFENIQNSFSKNRRLKSFIFLISCISIGISPHLFNKQPSLLILLGISLFILLYGVWVLSRNVSGLRLNQNIISDKFQNNLPKLDILVAARDEQNVISRLTERLFNLNYPKDKLEIYIIDDGSVDDTPKILKKLSKKYEKLNIIQRPKNAGGGKSGALNHALKMLSGDWVFILDADAQLKNDTLLRIFDFAYEGSWSAVQLRKSVLNTSKNFLTSCQGIEMAMDAYFQNGRLNAGGVSELRGNGQLIKKDILIKCGSFNENTVTDDLDLSFRLLLSEAKIGILWDPPVMEEAVETLTALFAQRQRWAEGGLQRFFDYGKNLITGDLKGIQKFDLLYFFVLQYALPIISLIDLIFSFLFLRTPIYWPISFTAFALSAIAAWLGCQRKHEGPLLPKNFLKIVLYLLYLSHWFVIIPLVALKMSILPKKIVWNKTIHKG